MATTLLIPRSVDLARVRQRSSVFYGMERPLAALLFLLALPLYVLVATLVAILSKNTPLVAHRRVGRDGHPFWMLKFRTMWGKDPKRSAGRWVERIAEAPSGLKTGRDPRVTSRFAVFCRRSSLDELPQILHVIRGDMSLVGPRPITDVELRQFYNGDSAEVLSLRPGITGLWQVLGRSRLSYAQRRRLDLFLTRHYSLALCARILLLTIPRTISGRDAW